MEFEENPFWLYPVKESQIDRLFINREDEVNKIKRMSNTQFKNIRIVCSILSGIGIGKSSMLRYVKKIAENNGFEVGLINGSSNILKHTEDLITKKDVALIDDVNKLIDEEARKLYQKIDGLLDEVTFVFFSDKLNRDREVEKMRDFTTSESIVLPKKMSQKKLKDFLEKRMQNCYIGEKSFENPFEKKALKMACDRSNGNLRSFLKYCQSAWFNRELEKEAVTVKEMKKSILSADIKKVSGLDRTDYKILWLTTIGDIHKSFLAQKCDISRQTLYNKLQGRLRDLTSVERVGKKTGKATNVSSIYSDIPNGKEQLKKIFEELGVNLEEIREETK